MNSDKKALELIQQSYFDLCDLLAGNSYADIGYDSRKEFLEILRDRLAEAEERLFPNEEVV